MIFVAKGLVFFNPNIVCQVMLRNDHQPYTPLIEAARAIGIYHSERADIECCGTNGTYNC